MGYRPQETHYLIEFPDMPGLELTMRAASIGEMIEAGKMPLTLNAQREDQLKMFDVFAENLVAWNIEHPNVRPRPIGPDNPPGMPKCKRCALSGGDPLPSTVDGLMCLDFGFFLKLMFGWMEGIMKVSVPKGMTLNNGSESPEDLMKRLAEQASPLT